MKNFYWKLNLSFISIIASFNLSAQSPFYFDPQACEATLNPNDSIEVYTVLKNATNDTVEFSFPGYTTFDQNFIVSLHPASGKLPPNSQEHIWITYSSVGFEPGTYEQELECVSSLPDVPQIFLHNVMHVTNPVQAGFKGYVTDAATGLPINDVKVVVGEHYAYTNGDGHYELPLDQGPFNVQFVREGYQTKIVEDTMALPGYSILDVQLQPIENYFLVGRVFAGDYPIESGFAYWYKMHEGIVVDIDAKMVGEEGYYEFTGLSAAPYIVQAEPSPSSIYYGDYLPTYYGDVLHWEEATVIDLTGNMDGANIHLIPVTHTPEGPGSISGNIDRGRSANIPVILRTAEPGTALMTYSSSDGSFVFSNLAYGNYEIFAEIPGKSIIPQTLVLDEAHQSAEGVDMMILEGQIIFTLGIGESEVFESASAIYPNPAKEKINILLTVKKTVIMSVQLADIFGKILQSCDYLVEGQQNIEIVLGKLPAGIYMIRCQSGNDMITKKFIRE